MKDLSIRVVRAAEERRGVRQTLWPRSLTLHGTSCVIALRSHMIFLIARALNIGCLWTNTSAELSMLLSILFMRAFSLNFCAIWGGSRLASRSLVYLITVLCWRVAE